MNPKIRSLLIALLGAGALVILVGCEDQTTNPAPEITPGPVLLVANQAEGAGNLSLVTLDNGAVASGVTGLGRFPNDIVVRNRKIWVINSDSQTMDVMELSNENRLAVLDTVDLGQGGNRCPQFADISSNGKMWISNFNDRTTTVLRISDHSVLAYMPVGHKPADVKVLGEKVYVCNSYTDTYERGSITVLSTTRNEVLKTIPVGVNPQSLDVDPSERLHVVCTGNYNDVAGEIYLINTQADTTLWVINIGGAPLQLAITSTGMGYLAAGGGWDGQSPGLVFCYNALTGQIKRGPDHPIEVGSGAYRITAGSDNSVYVACFAGNRVDKIVDELNVKSYETGVQPAALKVVE